MKKRWLRGILLGVSLALLLAGGVALAADLSASVDQECLECWPGPGEPTEEYRLWFTIKGCDSRYWLCDSMKTPADWFWEKDCFIEHPDPTVKWSFSLPCDLRKMDLSRLGAEVEFVPEIEDLYGEWTYRVWQEEDGTVKAGPAELTFLFADDCFAAMFVPEPGTIVLLGSGLAGLAGYASLRLRARRKREE